MKASVLFNTRAIAQRRSRDYLRGASSILNIKGDTSREYDFAPSDAEADSAAIGNDWAAVGGDLEGAVEAYRQHVR